MLFYGSLAIDVALQLDVPINKYADPTEGELIDIEEEYAREVVREDPNLIWVSITTTAAAASVIEAILDDCSNLSLLGIRDALQDGEALLSLGITDQDSVEEAWRALGF